MAKRIEQLDGIRAVAISVVVIHHLFNVKLLWMGVDLFFVLSGFLITGVLLDRKGDSAKGYFGYFYQRRARRILLPYLLLMVLTTILFGGSWAHSWYLYLFFMNFLWAFSLGKLITLSVLWSLAVEEQFYLVWPFVVYFLDEQAILYCAGGLVILAPLLRWICTPMFHVDSVIYCLTPFRMDTLAAGAVLQILWRQRKDMIKKIGVYGPILFAFALGALSLLGKELHFTTRSNTRESNLWIYELTLACSVGLMLWALSGRGTRILTLAPARYLARVSYTVYLFHLTISYMVVYYLHVKGDLAVAMIVIPVTLLYATASWHFFERPLLNTKPQPVPVLISA